MSRQSRFALEEFARDIRMGYRVNDANIYKLDFDIYGKAGTTSNIVYTYYPNENKLLRSEDGGADEEILDDLTNFQFNFYNLRKGFNHCAYLDQRSSDRRSDEEEFISSHKYQLYHFCALHDAQPGSQQLVTSQV